MSTELPPLPEPKCSQGVAHYHSSYTSDQMREYGRACERAAYERVEALCREIVLDLRGVHASAYDWQADGVEKCADEIANLSRALGADK